MPTAIPGPPPLATTIVNGLVSTTTQSFAGAKTFAAAIVANAGITLNGNIVGNAEWLSSLSSTRLQVNESLFKVNRSTPSISLNEAGAGTAQIYNTGAGVEVPANETRIYGRGSGASDVAVKIGPSTADGSVNASAKLLSIGTGVGGTFVEYAYFTKGGNLYANYLRVPSDGSGGLLLGAIGLEGNTAGGGLLLRYAGGAQKIVLNAATGLISQTGNDRSSTIGNDTQNNPTGINTLASGATTVTITNSLVPNPATTKVRIMISWRADPGARHWVTQNNGSFTVNLSAAPGSNVSFDWEVCGLT